MTGVAAAAICLGFASCSRYDFTPINEGEQAYANYENAFIEKFGEPAPDQTWGFGSADANGGGVAQGNKSCLKSDTTLLYIPFRCGL